MSEGEKGGVQGAAHRRRGADAALEPNELIVSPTICPVATIEANVFTLRPSDLVNKSLFRG